MPVGEPIAIENAAIRFLLDPERMLITVVEKNSGTAWLPDPWENSAGELVLRREQDFSANAQTEAWDNTALSLKRADAAQQISLDLSEARSKTVRSIPGGLQVRASEFECDGQTVDAAFAFEIIIPHADEPELVIAVTELSVDLPGYEIKELHFPARAFHLKTAQDHGYLVIPHDQGCVIPVGQKVQTPEQIIPAPCHGPYEVPYTRDLTFGSDPLSMPWFGMAREGGWAMGIVETTADASLRVAANDKPDDSKPRLGSLSPVWRSSKGELAYPRRITYRFEAVGGCVEMAKRFRRRAIREGSCVSLRDKLRRNPNLQRLFGAPVFEFNVLTNVANDLEFAPRLMGYRQLWYTFTDIERILRDLHDNLGVKKALIIVLGWGREGTDHGYPDLWPPNEEAGGLAGLRSLTETANELGYLIALHDCYYFTSEGAPSFDRDRDNMAVVNADTRCYPWDGGRCYEVCPTARLTYARRNLDIYKKELPLLTAHFTDCVSGAPLMECCHPDHPVTRTEDMRLKVEFCEFISREKGLIMGSEDAVDYLAPYCDYFNAAMEGGTEYGLMQGIRTPLWDLVYGDSVRSCWKEGDTYNTAGFARYFDYVQKVLLDLLSGNAAHWNFICGDCDYWRPAIKETYELLSPLSESLACEEMVEHEFVTEDYFVQRSRFSDGTEVLVNLRDKDCEVGALKIAARGFVVRNSPVGDMEGQLTPPGLRFARTGRRKQ